MKTKHRRLWPLLFLPILGSLAGLWVGTARIRAPFDVVTFDPIHTSALGLLAGSGPTALAAMIVLAYRVARRQFTIGAILILIAFIAVFLAWRVALCVASGIASRIRWQRPVTVLRLRQACARLVSQADRQTDLRRASASVGTSVSNRPFGPAEDILGDADRTTVLPLRDWAEESWVTRRHGEAGEFVRLFTYFGILRPLRSSSRSNRARS